MDLLLHLQKNAKVDVQALQNLIQDEIKKRADAKKNPRAIFQYLVSYGQYGATSALTHVMSEKELNALTPQQLLDVVKSYHTFPFRVYYYGPEENKKLVAYFNTIVPKKTANEVPAAAVFAEQPYVFMLIFMGSRLVIPLDGSSSIKKLEVLWGGY